VQGSGCRVQGAGFRVQGLVYRDSWRDKWTPLSQAESEPGYSTATVKMMIALVFPLSSPVSWSYWWYHFILPSRSHIGVSPLFSRLVAMFCSTLVFRYSFILSPVVPSFRALSGRLKLTVRRHKFNKDSLSVVVVSGSCQRRFGRKQRENSLLITYWSESTLSS